VDHEYDSDKEEEKYNYALNKAEIDRQDEEDMMKSFLTGDIRAK